MKELKKDSEILVLPADKGCAAEVMDREGYEQKMLMMLNDKQVYR